ncbi:MAG: hypothetical protein U1E78_00385 [Gammaproteobacteria bacterium]
MRLLNDLQIREISAGEFHGLGASVALPYQGERTFTDGFWNGATLLGPQLGLVVGTFCGLFLYPMHLVGFIDLNSHLPKDQRHCSC